MLLINNLMQHNFYYKQIGKISNSLLTQLQQSVDQLHYTECDDFCPTVLTVSNLPPLLLVKFLLEMNNFFELKGHIATNIAKIDKNSYLREHSDTQSLFLNNDKITNSLKIHVPILNTENAAMMWVPNIVTNFKVGCIYVIDNIKIHSAINLDNKPRYNLTTRFYLDSFKHNYMLKDDWCLLRDSNT